MKAKESTQSQQPPLSATGISHEISKTITWKSLELLALDHQQFFGSQG